MEPTRVIDIAKRELEKERELLMSRSMPGLPDNINDTQSVIDGNESDSNSDSDSEDNGKI